MMNDEPERPVFPEGIGPHEGRELELMLAGKKPLAMFYEAVVLPVSDFYPKEDFMPHVEAGTFIRRDEIYPSRHSDIPAHNVYYALAREAWRLEEIHQLQAGLFIDGKPWTAEDDRKIGQLLGYSESEIEAWLNWIRDKPRFQES